MKCIQRVFWDMEAVMARLAPDADPEDCHIEGCSNPAVFEVVKMKDNGSEKEEFFCQKHGEEFALRAHLTVPGA